MLQRFRFANTGKGIRKDRFYQLKYTQCNFAVILDQVGQIFTEPWKEIRALNLPSHWRQLSPRACR